MNVLAHLISPLPASSEASPHGGTTRILQGGSKTDLGDEEHLQLFSEVLLDRDKGMRGFQFPMGLSKKALMAFADATFDSLHKELPFK